MVSIVTSLYKSDAYLDAFSYNLWKFAEVLAEESFAFELIVIANEPTERELKFESDFKAQAWLKFVSVGREPLYATWNRGVEMAKAEIMGFWNVDDVRFPKAIFEANELFKSGAELVYFPFKIDRYVKILGRPFLIHKQLIDRQIPEFNSKMRKEFERSMLCGPFFMFTKSLYQKVGPFDEQFKIAGDYDWCARAAKISDKLVKAKTVAGEFRVDGSGLSAGGSPRQVVENNVVCRRQGALDKIQTEDAELAKQYNFKIIKRGEEQIIYV